MTGRDEKIDGHIDRYFALLQKQLDRTDDWPASFEFPAPQDDDERTAWRLFAAQIEKALPIRFAGDPGDA